MREFDELKLARIIDACNGVDGRVKLQKIVYLLRAMGYDVPFDDFWIRHYGPYSRAVAACADSLASAGFVEVSKKELPIKNSDGTYATQYSYKVRDLLKSLLKEHFDVRAPQGKPPVDQVATSLQQIDRHCLEVAATWVFLEQEDHLRGEELNSELKRLKGHLSDAFSCAAKSIESWKKDGWLSYSWTSDPEHALHE